MASGIKCHWQKLMTKSVLYLDVTITPVSPDTYLFTLCYSDDQGKVPEAQWELEFIFGARADTYRVCGSGFLEKEKEIALSRKKEKGETWKGYQERLKGISRASMVACATSVTVVADPMDKFFNGNITDMLCQTSPVLVWEKHDGIHIVVFKVDGCAYVSTHRGPGTTQALLARSWFVEHAPTLLASIPDGVTLDFEYITPDVPMVVFAPREQMVALSGKNNGRELTGDELDAVFAGSSAIEVCKPVAYDNMAAFYKVAENALNAVHLNGGEGYVVEIDGLKRKVKTAEYHMRKNAVGTPTTRSVENDVWSFVDRTGKIPGELGDVFDDHPQVLIAVFTSDIGTFRAMCALDDPDGREKIAASRAQFPNVACSVT